ncbi:MAG: PTS sugar transporter subunit IIA [Spirochaetales bacterium]|nr:PTS sugar transporter subunit IIA [Spirochaetales bacterium]
MLTANYEDSLSIESSSYVDISKSEATGCSIHRLKSRDKYGAIREIVNSCPVFEYFSNTSSKETFLKEIFDREALCTTGIGHNVAIPHGKCSSLDKVRIGLGISQEGLDFNSIDGEPVHLVLVIGSNPSNQVEYLKSLAYIMNHLKNPLLRTALTNLSFSYTIEKEDLYSRFLDIMKSQVFTS